MKSIILSFSVVLLSFSVFAQVQSTFIKIYNGPAPYESANSAVQTQDGGYCILCNITNGCSENIWLVRTNNLGDTLWTRTYDNGYRHAHTLVNAPDEGFTFVCENGNDLLVHVDSAGSILWEKSFFPYIENFFINSEGNYILVGGNYFNMLYMSCVSPEGTELWQKHFLPNNYPPCEPLFTDVKELPSGEYMITGGYYWPIGYVYHAPFILKVSSTGDSLHCRWYPWLDQTVFFRLNIINDSSLLIGGFGTTGTTILGTNLSGDTIWTRSEPDFKLSGLTTTDNGFLLISNEEINNEYHIILHDYFSNGNFNWEKNYDGGNYYGYSVRTLPDGGFLISGTADTSALLIRTDEEGKVNGLANPVSADVQIYPNPAHDYIFIKNSNTLENVSIIDLTGKTVMKAKIFQKKQPINIENLHPGFYILKTSFGSVKFLKI